MMDNYFQAYQSYIQALIGLMNCSSYRNRKEKGAAIPNGFLEPMTILSLILSLIHFLKTNLYLLLPQHKHRMTNRTISHLHIFSLSQ